MKKILLSLFTISLLVACNPIPNKSIFTELTTDELSAIIKADPEFKEVYESIRILVEMSALSEVQKAQYNEITYRRMAKYYYHRNDEEYIIAKTKCTTFQNEMYIFLIFSHLAKTIFERLLITV